MTDGTLPLIQIEDMTKVFYTDEIETQVPARAPCTRVDPTVALRYE